MSRSVILASGVEKEIAERFVIDEAGVERVIAERFVIDETGVERQVWGGAAGGGSALAATASPDAVSGARSSRNPTPVNTNTTTVTADGGIAPYTYAWSANAGWTVSAPTGATTSFSSVVSPGQDATAAFICKVTDAKGSSVTVNVEAQVSNYGYDNAQLQ